MSEGAWNRFLEHAARARTKPTFEVEEREPKLELAAGSARALAAVRDGGDWITPLRDVLRPPARHSLVPPRYRLVPPRQRRWLLEWGERDPESLRAALAPFVDDGLDPTERFARFAAAGERVGAAEEASDEGARLSRETATITFGSLFNCARDPESLPIVRGATFVRLRELLGLPPIQNGSPVEQYAAQLEFAREVRKRLDAHSAGARDMVDAQSLISIGVSEQAIWTADPPPDWEARGSREVPEDGVYLAACVLYKNEAPYLREWIEFHRLVGVERFFMYDNGSTDGDLDILAPYREKSLVNLHSWFASPPDQREVYDECLRAHGGHARWIAFLDIDEFLFSPTGLSVAQVLRDYERWPGVVVNWAMFGASGHQTRPEGLVTENYVLSDGGETGLTKSVIDPGRTTRTESAHHFAYEYGLAVDENRWPAPGGQTKSTSFGRLRINHYASRSEEDVRARGGRAGNWNHLALWRQRDVEGQLDLKPDDAIARYLPKLKTALEPPPPEEPAEEAEPAEAE